MKITVWADFACPFCYMGETLLNTTLDELNMQPSVNSAPRENDVTIEFRAYELNPEAPETPVQTMAQHFASEHDISGQDALLQMQHISKMAKRVGLDYNLEGVQVCSTLDAHRLMKYAIEKADDATVLQLNSSLFRANFIENLLLSDRKVLADIAESAGFDRHEVEAMLSSGKYTDEVRNDEKEAENLNLEYIPYLIMPDGKALQGVLSKGALKKALSPAMQ